jgi:hypothetical protein
MPTMLRRPWRKAGYRSEGDASAHGKGAVYWLDGTRIRWGASWDRTIMGRLVYPSLRNLYPVIVAGLVQAAESSQS